VSGDAKGGAGGGANGSGGAAVLLSAVGLAKRYVRRSWLAGGGSGGSGGGGPVAGSAGGAGSVAALAGVDLEVRRGECLGIVGESGSGKTTLALCLLRLLEPTAGRVLFDGEDLTALSPRDLRRRRRHFQMIYQDPFDSLDPRQKVGAAVAEPLRVRSAIAPPGERPARRLRGAAASAAARALLATVGLPAHLAGRLPHELSGGQRQRVGIARALAMEPQLLIADEPVSALDISVRSQILNLLADLQQRMGLTLLLIAHDLSVVEQMADRVAVFYCGRIVELGPCQALFSHPLHPYTASLIAAVPAALPAAAAALAEEGTAARRVRPPISGEAPSAEAPPPGCPFHPRCPLAQDRCRVELPPLLAAAVQEPGAAAPRAGDSTAAPAPGERQVACFFPLAPGVAPLQALAAP
jgi:oligopeptide/dipeptide ABC transporter ATP-binding protein